ncbi:MAG TPA: hypothetical protein VGF55_33030 [Gemmataceae bacterium]|jgi:hypothetical protein
MPDSPLPAGAFDDLRRTLAADGPAAAADQLVETLRRAGNLDALFYALLLRARLRLGADPVPTRPAAELPEALHTPYEEAIRDAARTVGRLYLEAGDIPHAWNYFRLIGEPGPVRDALDAVVLEEDDDFYPLVEIALHHGVNPRKGFDLVLARQGICNAITLFGGFEAALAADVRAYFARRLVESLHDQLRERLRYELLQHGEAEPPAGATVAEMTAGRDWLFADDAYLIDVSHLGAVVQAATQLPPGDAGLRQAIELADYGARLAPNMKFPGDPPFEDLYADHAAYLRVLVGEDVQAGLERFRAKAEAADPEEVGPRPAEVYVNLLLHAGRQAEAAAAARKLLANVDERGLGCPGPLELARRQGDYAAFAEVARGRGDAVHFLAGLLATRPAHPE